MLLSFAIFWPLASPGNALILQRKPTAPAAATAADKAPARSQGGARTQGGRGRLHKVSPWVAASLRVSSRAQVRAADGGKEEIQLRIARFCPRADQHRGAECHRRGMPPTIPDHQRHPARAQAAQLWPAGRSMACLRPRDARSDHGLRARPAACRSRARLAAETCEAHPARRAGWHASSGAGRQGGLRHRPRRRSCGGVQRSLVGLGYQPGAIDGRFGDDTSKAIREFGAGIEAVLQGPHIRRPGGSPRRVGGHYRTEPLSPRAGPLLGLRHVGRVEAEVCGTLRAHPSSVIPAPRVPDRHARDQAGTHASLRYILRQCPCRTTHPHDRRGYFAAAHPSGSPYRVAQRHRRASGRLSGSRPGPACSLRSQAAPG